MDTFSSPLALNHFESELKLINVPMTSLERFLKFSNYTFEIL